mmetsp:Transcript_38891/g.77180  ORF Transcript_38891/g.77180 Transcript_38891/m.77180 type:complete len:370 (+) Transcript_38891:95-1204(+)
MPFKHGSGSLVVSVSGSSAIAVVVAKLSRAILEQLLSAKGGRVIVQGLIMWLVGRRVKPPYHQVIYYTTFALYTIWSYQAADKEQENGKDNQRKSACGSAAETQLAVEKAPMLQGSPPLLDAAKPSVEGSHLIVRESAPHELALEGQEVVLNAGMSSHITEQDEVECDFKSVEAEEEAAAVWVDGHHVLVEDDAVDSNPPETDQAANLTPIEVQPAVEDILGTVPDWVGSWKLDKSCSEPYGPIMESMGVGWISRKAVDAASSMMIFSVNATHVRLEVKMLGKTVSTEETPLDGSWRQSPIPAGTRMKGEVRVKVVRVSDTELQFYTEFPGDNGDLTDTLTVSEDRTFFTRVCQRGSLTVKRVFRREGL